MPVTPHQTVVGVYDFNHALNHCTGVRGRGGECRRGCYLTEDLQNGGQPGGQQYGREDGSGQRQTARQLVCHAGREVVVVQRQMNQAGICCGGCNRITADGACQRLHHPSPTMSHKAETRVPACLSGYAESPDGCSMDLECT